jgi:hypothetical protein
VVEHPHILDAIGHTGRNIERQFDIAFSNITSRWMVRGSG